MKIHKVVYAVMCLEVLLVQAIPQHPGPPQRLDIWKAMEISLRKAQSVHPKGGFVPDESTAVKIAEAVAIAEYGEKTISKERPFRARLYGNIWLVIGTLHPEGAYGGTAVVKLSRDDGKIVFMMHQY